MAAKKKINLLNTCDLNLSAFKEIDPSRIITSNIYISEALNLKMFNTFQSLKKVAKGLGFKYIWHCKGSFLVKWNDGERAHVFESAADLSAIALSYKTLGSSAPAIPKID